MDLGFLDMGEVDQTRVLGGIDELQLVVIDLDGLVVAPLFHVAESLVEHLVVAAQYPCLASLGQLQVVLPDVVDEGQAALHVCHRQHVGRCHVGVAVVMCFDACCQRTLVILEGRGAQVVIVALLGNGLVHAAETQIDVGIQDAGLGGYLVGARQAVKALGKVIEIVEIDGPQPHVGIFALHLVLA